MATRKDSTDAQMMFVGSACGLASCNQHDFLPIRCDLCSESFCFDHFRPNEHKCAKFDPAKADRVAPSCPLCNTPISIPIGHDPNLKMDAHIMNECRVMGNKNTTRQTPRCAGPRCTKTLIAPIRCDNCRKQFCAEHRFPQQHSCAAPSVSRPSPVPQSQNPMSKLSDKLPNVNIGNLRSGQGGPSAAAAMAAINRAAASAKPKPAPTTVVKPQPAAASGSSSSNKPAVANPFNKTDRCDPNLSTPANADAAPTINSRPARIDTSYLPPPLRARAERVSQLKALQERNKKGLLSNAEKSRLAELQTEAKQNGDCVLM